MDKITYNKNFYEYLNITTLKSAEAVVPVILEELRRNELINSNFSVCDLGCGEGAWLSVFKLHGAKICGYDGNDVLEHRLIDTDEYQKVNLCNPLENRRKYDLAVSLEVAEHIPGDKKDVFLDNLSAKSDIIIFSAAIPFQMGQGHINEQYPSYWIKEFKKRGYVCIDQIREKIWNDENVLFYYRQNMFFFMKENEKNSDYIKKYYRPVMDVIHPGLWEKVQSWLPVRIMVGAYNNKYVYYVYLLLKKIRRKVNCTPDSGQ